MHLLFLIKIAALALLRSWRATAVLVLMIFSAVAILVFTSALAVGTNDAMIRNSTGLFTGHISASNLTPQDIRAIQATDAWKALVRKHRGVMLTNSRYIDRVDLIGINAGLERQVTALERKIISGDFPEDHEKTVLLSSTIADRLHVQVGDAVNVNESDGTGIVPLRVAGIYKTGLSRLDSDLAFCPAEAVPGRWQKYSAAIFLDNGVSLEQVLAQLRAKLPAAVFTGWVDFMPDLKQLIELDNICMALVILLVFAIVALGIAYIFLIFSLKNIHDYGILKALGLQAADIAMLLLAQITILNLAAISIGTLTGYLLVLIFSHMGIDIGQFTSHNQYFAVSGVIYPRATPLSLLAPPAAALGFGLLSSIWPVAFVVRKNPADILRSL